MRWKRRSSTRCFVGTILYLRAFRRESCIIDFALSRFTLSSPAKLCAIRFTVILVSKSTYWQSACYNVHVGWGHAMSAFSGIY
jgi:hypothetical protein